MMMMQDGEANIKRKKGERGWDKRQPSRKEQ